MPEMTGLYLIIVRQSNRGAFGVSVWPTPEAALEMLDQGFPHRTPLSDTESYTFSKEDVNGKFEGIVGIDFIPAYGENEFKQLKGGTHDSINTPKLTKRPRSERAARKESDARRNGARVGLHS